MSKFLQVYYHALFGALGGLLGWWIVGSIATQTWNIWAAAAVVGTGLGLCIGGMIAATDSTMIKRVPKRALYDGAIGALAGAIAGLLGFLLAQGAFLVLTGGFVGRALSWMLLGLLIGVSDFAVHRQLHRARYAAIGGLAGGLAGGLIYEALTQLFLAQSGTVQVILGGLGLVIVGACIGGLMPLARQVLSQAELRVISGEQTGLVREVTDITSIGRYDGNDLYLPDAGVSWRHATVRCTDRGFELVVLPDAEQAAEIGAYDIIPGGTRMLYHGDQIRIGAAVVEFVGR
ncbi:MAG: FHA domain-containing protein [Chloroflexaceae bacterium]|nr:FHA domain-containing protein [Chloroflexaceae bacterium]